MAASESLSVAFLYDDTLDNDDGVAQYVKRLGAWYKQQGHQVTYLVGESKTAEWAGGRVYSLSKNLKIKWAGNSLSISLIPKLSEINRVIAENRFDVVHVQAPYSPFMAKQVINRLDKRTVVSGIVHVFPANRLAVAGSRLLRLLYGRSLRRIDVWASVSPAAQKYAKIGFGIDSVVLPNVVPIDEFKTAKPRETGWRIVFLGRLVKRKGCEYLIRAAIDVLKSGDDVRLVIGGAGPEQRRLIKMARQLQIDDKVDFLGYVAETDKPELLAGADIACFPSLYGESFGIVLIEAMAAGAGVVIGGNNPGYTTVLEDWPDTLVDPKNQRQFSSTLKRLLSDEKLASSLHKKQQIAVKKYDVAVVGRQWLDIYDKLIAKQQQKRHN